MEYVDDDYLQSILKDEMAKLYGNEESESEKLDSDFCDPRLDKIGKTIDRLGSEAVKILSV